MPDPATAPNPALPPGAQSVQPADPSAAADEVDSTDPELSPSIVKMGAKLDAALAPWKAARKEKAEKMEKSMEAAEEGKPRETGKEKPAAPVPSAISVSAAVEPGQPQPSASADAPPPPDPDEPPENLSQKAKDHWKIFRDKKNAETAAAVAAKEQELSALRSEVEAFRKKPTSSPEFERLKAEKLDLEERLERVALEQSPKFKDYYEGGIQRQLDLAAEAGGEHGKEIARLLQQPRSKERNDRLNELVKDLGIDGQLIVQAMGEITRLTKEKETQLSRHKEGLKLLRAAEAREAEQKQQAEQKQRQSTAEAIVTRASSLPEFKVNGDADQSSFAPEALTFIRNASLGQLSPEDQQLLPVAAMRAMWHDRINVPKLKAEIASLKSRVSELTGSQPGIADGSLKPSKEPESGFEPGQSSFEKAYARAMAGAGQT